MTTAQRLYEEALELPDTERRQLAEDLLRSLPDALAAWEAELERRVEEADSDPGQLVPWDEALGRIFDRSTR